MYVRMSVQFMTFVSILFYNFAVLNCLNASFHERNRNDNSFRYRNHL